VLLNRQSHQTVACLSRGRTIIVPAFEAQQYSSFEAFKNDNHGLSRDKRYATILSSAYRAKFSGKYESRVIAGGIGHNPPQEAPAAFAEAIIGLDHV
jgi:hypothetical protein